MSALETETLHDSTTFEHFGREWTVPTKRHLSHMRRMREMIQSDYGTVDMIVAEVFLTGEQYDALCEIDPDEDELEAFVQKIADALGLGDSGNS